MSAGLPAAGLGALLYLLLVVVLPLRTLLTRPGKADWRQVTRQMAVVAVMVGVAALETEFALWLGFMPATRLVRFIPVFLLATVISALELVRVIMRVRRRRVS